MESLIFYVLFVYTCAKKLPSLAPRLRCFLWTFKHGDLIWIILYFNEKNVVCTLIFNALEEIPFDFICGSFPTLQCFDNGDSDFIHQEFLLLFMTARESEGNTLHLKHVFLWDSSIRITGLISSPLWKWNFYNRREKERRSGGKA